MKEILRHAFAILIPALVHSQTHSLLSDIPTNRELVNSRGYFYDKEKVGELRDLMKKTAEDGCASVDYSDILDRYSVERMIDAHIEAYLGRSGGHENPPLAPRKGGNGMEN